MGGVRYGTGSPGDEVLAAEEGSVSWEWTMEIAAPERKIVRERCERQALEGRNTLSGQCQRAEILPGLGRYRSALCGIGSASEGGEAIPSDGEHALLEARPSPVLTERGHVPVPRSTA